MPTDPNTLPGTVARTSDDEDISARTGRIASNRRNYGAGATGLEPATSGVTGRRSNRLSYATGKGKTRMPSLPKWRVRERNSRNPYGFELVADGPFWDRAQPGRERGLNGIDDGD